MVARNDEPDYDPDDPTMGVDASDDDDDDAGDPVDGMDGVRMQVKMRKYINDTFTQTADGGSYKRTLLGFLREAADASFFLFSF